MRKLTRMQSQGWIDKNALATFDAGIDPMAAICGRQRAARGGKEYVAPLTSPPEALPAPTAAAPNTPTPNALVELLFAANAERSGAAIKVLLAVLQKGEETSISISAFMAATGLKSNNTVIAALRECLDWGWLKRRQRCPRCLGEIGDTEERIVLCVGCGRQVSPEACYQVQNPTEGMQNMQTGMQNSHTASAESAEGYADTEDGGLHNLNTGLQEAQTSPMQNLKTGGMQNVQTAQERINRLIGQTGEVEPATRVQNMQTGMQNTHTGIQELQTPRVRADSDSESVNRISDSRIPSSSGGGETGRVVYGSQGWQQMTERLAKDSAKRIGDKSVGFHVKCWSHARKLDWEQGGRHFEEGLLTIAQELADKHSKPGPAQGRSQGAMWTKMVRRYFEERGHPLLTEAQVEEWRELHGTYQPPQL